MELIITEKLTNPSICLNMIVKNESHIIKRTLEKLCSKIVFSYWVICDTGSTDNTREIITDFFKSLKIPGEMHKDEWQDFAHNRTIALQKAFGKTDLLLVFDADDEIVGFPELPGVNATIYDEYHMKFGSPLGTAYTRVLLVNNMKRFVYQSVIHECIVCVEPANVSRTNAVIEGDYYIVSGRSGNRSLDPEKYLKDAKILEGAHAEAVLKNDPLFKRYAFYCANSYKDYGSLEDAIKWYKITLGQENWAQEHYMSCFHIFECYQKLNQTETGFFYLVKAFKYDQERVECLYPLLVHYCCEGQYRMAYNYYLQVKDFYETKYLSTNVDGKLFVSIDKYNFFMPYYMILIADKMEDYDCVIKMFEIVFTKKMPVADDHYVGNILFNLQFFVQRVKSENMTRFINLATEYIRFLSDLGIQLQRHEFLREYETRFGIDVSYIFSNVVLKNKMNFSKEECKKSKNILIYTGLMYFLWNDTYVSTKSIGGAEKAVAYLFRYFSKEYNIFISGDVEDEVIDNVTYINRDKLQNLLEKTKFHTIIVSRYISFFLMYNNFSCYKLFLSAHDSTGFINNYNNNRLSLNDIVETWNPIIDGCIALTTWHKNNIIERHPCLKDKIHIINNGILPEIFPLSSKKIRNKFVWTSCSYRGLHVMLNLWKDILESIPDATLDIASYDIFPKNADDLPMQEVIIKYPNSIKHRGKLNTSELNNLISTAEYWLYTNTFPETSCITGMEMLMSEVICLYYPLAGLLDTVGEYGIQVNPGSEVDTILNLTEKQKIIMRKRGKDYALTCSWENRAKEWENVLFEGLDASNIKNNKFKINIINLARRPDRKNQMINALALQNVYNYEFVEAVDGKILEPSIFIKNLFKENDFNYRKGVIGCALSHYTLWHKLLNDVENDYYVILEDDVSVVEHFNRKLQKCIDIVTENNIEYALIGGNHMLNECTDINNINFNKIIDPICHGTHGYIISKSACYKLIKHIQTNGIKYAIDYSPIYTDCLDMYKINNYLVTSKTYQLDNNMDTDIQLDYDHFDFDSIPTYQIAFTDWWIDEYCGGMFDKENNFLKNMLSKHYNIRVVEPEHNPDVLFYSMFGNNHKNLQAKRKVFFSGEPHSQRDDADFNITFDANSDRNCRLPLWTCYLDNILFDDCYQKKTGLFTMPNKPKFCSIICQLDSKTKERSEIVNKLSQYKQVDCGGAFLNNIGYVVPRGINCSGKIKHNNNYKFALAIENTNYPGYVTEKICDVYKSKCIPIYWGSKEVVNDFNPRTFINANDFSTFDELVEYIEKVDNNQELYESYFMEPIFSNYWLNIFNDIDQTFFLDLANNIVGNYHKITSKIEPNNVFFNSQSGQDEYVETHIFKGYKNGFYVDVGAHDGITINNTLYFEKANNWTGINIEPIKTVFDKLVNNRPNNINLNCAVCNNDGETEFLCNTGYTEMISGIKSNFDPRHLQRLDNENRQMGSTTEVIKVKTKKLETIFNENNISHINYLSIDVEGAEFEVIKSINFDKVFIDLIEFENNFDDTGIPIIKYLETKNYVVCNTHGDIFMINKNSIFYKPKFKTIGFHSNQLCERGTDVAMYDYAYYNEKMYNNKSIIFYCKHNSNNDVDVIKKFETQFKCYGYDNFSDIEQIIQDERIDYFYNCKSGSISDNQLIKSCPNLIHAVFTVEPHGEKYAAISKQLSEKYNNIADFVPYMINLPKCDKNARQQFNIPNDAIVIGRYGGYSQFDIQVAHEAIKSILNTDLNLYFLFANTNVFYEHPRIIYLNKIIDLEDKVTFINTCDAMIHARSDGETFGLAVGEFSSCNKPIITCKSVMDNSHIDILGEKGIIYGSKESLIEIFKNIKNIINSRSDWNAYAEYSPENVMEKFFKVFIDSSKIIDYNKINYIDMNRSCISTSNKNDPNLIIVSAFLDIGRDNWDKYERTTQLYINSFLNYLNYDNKMIIFIDDMYINEIKEKYEQSLYKNKIFIPINIEWMKQNIHAWQKLELDRSIMNSEIYKTTVQNRINNNYPENIYPEYNAINHAKIDFICYAINNNLIGKNDFICWSDFGYFNSILHNNSKLYPVAKLGINNFNLNKLSFCLRNKLDENDNDMFYTFINAPEKFTGSFFSGSINLMIELQELYHKSLEELHANNISDDDQHLYLRCFKKNPDIFELYLSNNEWPKALIYFEQAPTKNNIYTFDVNQSTCLCEIMGKYGSDKGHINIMESHHNYTTFYYSIFKNIQMEQLRIFELGLGTNNVNIKSNMGINGSPGASLYGWREFFINSKIYGADIDKDILFNTDKIKTFYCDQTNSDIIKSLWNNLELNENFDIIIEDGLHDFNANVCFFENSIHKLKPNGYFIIEDILNYEEQLFIIKIKEWETKYIDCLFTLLKIPSLRNNSDNTLLVVFKRTI